MELVNYKWVKRRIKKSLKNLKNRIYWILKVKQGSKRAYKKLNSWRVKFISVN